MTFSGLVSDDGKTLSIGRVAFWIILFTDMVFWWLEPINKFPDTLYYVTSYLLAYNFGKKLVDPLTAYVSSKSSSKDSD